MSNIIAALLLPIPVLHLWLHALLPAWRRQPLSFYVFCLLLWAGAFFLVPKIEQVSPIAFVPGAALQNVALAVIGLGVLLMLASLLTLGFRRFFLWGVLHPAEFPVLKPSNFIFILLPHPAYFGYILVAVGNVLTSGKFYTIGILALLLILLPLVIWLEEEELKSRIKNQN